MKQRALSFARLVLPALLFLFSVIPPARAFYVATMDPVAGSPGTQVMLSGKDFDEGFSVRLDGTTVEVDTVTAETVTFTIPDGASSGTVELTDGDQTSTVALPLLVTREISGRLSLPPNLAGPDWFVATGEGDADVAADGSFVITVPADLPAMVWAVRNGNEPSFMTLVLPADDTAAIDVTTTAASLVYLVPPVASPLTEVASARWHAILDHSQLGDLAALIDEAASAGRDYLPDGRREAIQLAIVLDVLGGGSAQGFSAAGFKDGAPKGARFLDLLPEPASGPLAYDKVMDSKLTHEKAADRFVFTYDTAREPSLDYVIDIYQLDPGQFESGFESVGMLDGESAYDFISENPVAQGFTRAKLAGRKLDYFGFLYDTIVAKLTKPLDDKFKPNEFIFHESIEGVFAAHAYSGNIWYGLDRSPLGQANLLDEIDPNNQWAWTLGTNITLASLDLAGLFVNVKKLTGFDDAGYLDSMIKNTVKALLIYRSQNGGITSDQVYDLVKTMAGSIIKTFILPGSDDEGIVKRFGSLTFRITGTMADAINIFKKIGTGLNIAERTFNMVSPKNLAVERAVFVLGDPFDPVISRIEPRLGREGTEVYIHGVNLYEYPADGEEDRFPVVEFCTFPQTSEDPDNAPVDKQLAAEVVSAAPNRVVVKVPPGWTDTFGTILKAYICVTRADSGNLGNSRPLGEDGLFEYIPPPKIVGVEPEEIVAGSHFVIRGEGFTSDCQVMVDGFLSFTPLRIERDYILVAFPNQTVIGPRKLTVKCGEIVSNEFDIDIGVPEFNPPAGTAGVGVTVSKVDMSNAADGEISLLEAFLIASGGLGRTIEIHDPCENISDPETPGYCGGFTQRETDFVSGDNEFGQGGGAEQTDSIVVSLDFSNQVFNLGQALPSLGVLDSVDFRDVTLSGTGASAGTAAITIDNGEAASVKNLVLSNWPGDGIYVANGSDGVVLEDITVDGVGGRGIAIQNESSHCRLSDIAIDNVDGTGLHIEGDCKYTQISRVVVNFAGGHGVHLETRCEANVLDEVTIQGSGGDGFRIEGASNNNKFTRIDIATSNGAGLRILGSHFNRMMRPRSGLTDFDALVHPRSHILDGQDWGVVIEGGSQNNVLAFSVVGQNAAGGILVRGEGTGFNMIGKPYSKTKNFSVGGDPLIYPMVADNGGPGIRIAEGAAHNTMFCLNVAGNGDDGVQIDGEGSDENELKAILTGLRFFIADSAPQNAPNQGDGISITGGAKNNHITHWARALGLFGNDNNPYRTSIQLDTANGILIDGEGTDGNRVDNTTIGSNMDTRRLGDSNALTMNPVGHNGIAITGGASHNEIGSMDLAEDVHIDACPESGILVEDEGTNENRLIGCFIGDVEVFFDYAGDPNAGCFYGITLRDGPMGTIVGQPGPMRGSLFGAFSDVDNVNSIKYCREAGIVLDNCGGFIDADGERVMPNVLRNNAINNCATGILIQNDAQVNDIGGPRGFTGSGFVQISQYYTIHENSINAPTRAGIHIHNNAITDERHRNIFLNTSVSYGPAGDVSDFRAGPPGGVGVLIDGNSTGNIIGEELNDARCSITGCPVGVYFDEVLDNEIRGWSISGGFTLEPLFTGVVLKDAFDNRVGGNRWSRRNEIEFISSNDTDLGHGIAVIGGGENFIRNNDIGENSGVGVLVENSNGNRIGDGGASANVIVLNGNDGVRISGVDATENAVRGNYIGVEKNGAYGANEGSGVKIENGAANNFIGGASPVISNGSLVSPPAGNEIARNLRFGIHATGGGTIGNSILNNSIHANELGGIRNEGGGNEELEPPTEMSYTGSRVVGSVADISKTPAGSIVQVFSDADMQGEVMLGQTTVRAGGAWILNGPLPAPHPNITATITSASTGSTSRFGVVDEIERTFTMARADGQAPSQRTVSFNDGPVAVLPFRLEVTGDPVVVRSLTFAPQGTLSDATAVISIAVYYDADSSFALSAPDLLLGEATTYPNDGEEVEISVGGTVIDPDAPQTWLLVYETTGAIADGTTFSVQIASASAVNAELVFPIGIPAMAQASYPVRSDSYVVGEAQESAYELWRQQHFADALDDPEISGSNADPDGDHIRNGVEFFTGGDPRTPDAESIFRLFIDGNELVLRLRRGSAADLLNFTAAGSTDLVNWDGSTVSVTTVTIDGAEWTEVRAVLGPEGRAFIRFIIEGN